MARFSFGTHHYPSKKAAQAEIRAIRNGYTEILGRTPVPPGCCIRITNAEHEDKLLSLWETHHPHHHYKTEKVGGVSYVGFRQDRLAANNDAQFVIVGPTGLKAVMSVVLPFEAPNPMQMWFHAMRLMITDQQHAFIQGLDFPIVCGATGTTLFRGQAQVDHYPTPFSEIALDFIETHYDGGLAEWLSYYTPANHYSFFRDHEDLPNDGWFIDDQLVREWQAFHQDRATYRPTSGSANASEGQAHKARMAPRIAAQRARFGTKKIAS